MGSYQILPLWVSWPGNNGNEGVLHIPPNSRLTIRLFCVISGTLIRPGVFNLCRNAVGVFNSSSQLGWIVLDRNIWNHITVSKFFLLYRNTWNHITVSKFLVLYRNTWNHITVSKFLVLYRNTWNHITVSKFLVLYRNTWNHITVYKLFVWSYDCLLVMTMIKLE